MKSILVIGMGRFGKHLALKMRELGNDVMIVDKNEEIIDELAPMFTDSYIGDCCHEGVLRSLGVGNFDICFVTIGEDFQSSLEITSLLKDLGAQYIVSKAGQDIQAKFLTKIGANEVITPEKSMAKRLAVRYNADNVFEFIELDADYSIYEIPVVKAWINKSVSEVNVRRVFHVNIIAIKHEDQINPAPGGDYIFKQNDHLVVIGRSSDVFKLTAKA
ncbi:MAG: TrkA family potassium uptake protein [Clostridiales bacterium]|jgi:trk system potassium uptake protein TrkA|nr:TrkA family potassium uptake protein [Clostridiales bacterium]